MFCYLMVYLLTYTLVFRGIVALGYFTNWAMIVTAIYMKVSVEALKPKAST